MIKGTNTNCKITDISVVGSTATLTCLFFASNTTKNPVGLNFYLVDKDNDDITLLDNTTYWIDNINAHDTNLLNVNINGYKEVKLKIDITKDNTSIMQNTRWLRKCYIQLVDVTDSYLTPLWSSDILNLVSDSIEIPKIKNITFYNKKVYITQLNDFENKLYINFKYSYASESDFNYTNTNIKTIVIIKSITTGKELEKIEVPTQETMKLESSKGYNYTEPVIIEIYITNLKNEILESFSYIYKPFIKKATGYIKTTEGVKKIYRLVVVKEDNVLNTNPNNLALKINYTASLYAHFDRITYTKQVIETVIDPLTNQPTLQETTKEFHKCVLHINSFIKDTNFNNVIITIKRGNEIISQKTDINSTEIVLQDDTNDWVSVTEPTYQIEGLYSAQAFTKKIYFNSINRGLVCSKKLKLHKGMRPFNYNNAYNINQEDNTNE